jgi:Flp pilus assembly protein TadD
MGVAFLERTPLAGGSRVVKRQYLLSTRVRIVLSTFVALMLAGCASSGMDQKTTQQPLSVSQGSELRLARAARAAGDLASAINVYRSIIASGPGHDEVIVELGDVLLDAGALDDAMDAYEKVGADAAAKLGAELGLARASLKLAQSEAALAHFQKASDLAPEDVRCLVGLGVALDLLDRHDEAQQKYRAVLKLQPRHVAARNDLALSLALTGRYPDALEILAPLAMSSTATPRIRQNLALIYGLMGDARKAVAMGRMDLDEAGAEANQRFFQRVKSESAL